MPKPTPWITIGCVTLVACVILLKLGGPPSYGRQVSRFYFLCIAGILCLGWGVIQKLTSRKGPIESQQVEGDTDRDGQRHPRKPATQAPEAGISTTSFGRRTPSLERSPPPRQAFNSVGRTQSERQVDRHQEISALLEADRLVDAIQMIETSIEASGNAVLIDAAKACSNPQIDWETIECEAIEADAVARRRGPRGCTDVHVQLANLSENRLNVYRFFYSEPDLARGIIPPKGYVNDRLEISSLAPLAEIEARPTLARPTSASLENGAELGTLVATLIVLRFFDAVSRAALNHGFPFPVRLSVDVDNAGGPEGYRKLRNTMRLSVRPIVQPLDQNGEACLRARYSSQLASQAQDCERLIRNLRQHYDERGWVQSRFIPESLVEDKARFRGLEETLLANDPDHRPSPWEVDELCGRIRSAWAYLAPSEPF